MTALPLQVLLSTKRLACFSLMGNSTMAEFDRLTNQTTYKKTLKQFFVLAESINPDFLTASSVADGLNYGYAAARAYNTYQNPIFLDLAVTSWTTARRYTISKEQAVSGSTDIKQSELAPSCNGTTLTGGTYSYGLWTYLDAAIESANFIQSHFLDPSNTVMAFLSSNLSQYCTMDTSAFSTNTGIFVEGLVILADITRNTSTEAFIIVAITTNTSWQGLDGILDVGSDGGHYIVRALAALYERNTTTSNLREYIKEYIGVQYNGVIEKATLGGSNIYGIPWTGPPRTVFSSANQTVAVSALLSGIQLLNNQPLSKPSDSPTSSGISTESDNPTSTRTPTTNTTTSPLSSKKKPTGAIVGSVVGGLAVLVVIIVGLFLWRRRHHQKSHPTPFMTTSVTASSEIPREHRISQGKNARYPVPSRRDSSSSLGAVETDRAARRGDARVGSTTPHGAAASSPNPLDMPTEELLRLLNDRLRPCQWNDLPDELPPEYHEGRTT
ncbi:hypothetical protein ARMGADRAFT_1128195 [Armillaria gallica]|uniref:Glycoside hydrolase family 76 protein n=1 Tax=Armillaria gallica TaxID=47427 RepID=A0A2H3DF81_ARMGA|nr:hypothetical protein ARMGADRAFT_1128195 [Armillaria gallica]